MQETPKNFEHFLKNKPRIAWYRKRCCRLESDQKLTELFIFKKIARNCMLPEKISRLICWSQLDSTNYQNNKPSFVKYLTRIISRYASRNVCNLILSFKNYLIQHKLTLNVRSFQIYNYISNETQLQLCTYYCYIYTYTKRVYRNIIYFVINLIIYHFGVTSCKRTTHRIRIYATTTSGDM